MYRYVVDVHKLLLTLAWHSAGGW